MEQQLPYLQLYLHQGASLHPSVEVPVPPKSLDDSGQDVLALGFIQNGRCSGGQVNLHPLLQMEGELGVGQQVGVPVPGPRGASDVQAAIQIVEPDLSAAGLFGCSAPGGDVDSAIPFQGLFHSFIHSWSCPNQGGRAPLAISYFHPWW
jgi:hypothetical protein